MNIGMVWGCLSVKKINKSMKNYTHNWNQEFIKNTQGFKKKLSNCLEIGSFEGLTSNYIVENLISETGKLICIDPLTDVYINENLSESDDLRNRKDFKYFEGQYMRFVNNVEEHLSSGKIELIRDLSTKVLPRMKTTHFESFDFIYIDGDHRPEIVYFDAVNTFELCKKDGYILFDDYRWNDTGVGVDRFLSEYSNRIKILIKDYQVLVQKI